MKPIIVFFGVLYLNILIVQQELQLAINIRVGIFNGEGILWTYKKLFDECGFVLSIGLLQKLQNLLPTAALFTICKTFIRHQLNYGDILYDQAYDIFSPKAGFHSVKHLLDHNQSHTRHIKRKKVLPRTRFRVTPITMLVNKTQNVLQNL